MEEMIPKRNVPALPEGLKIRYVRQDSLPRQETGIVEDLQRVVEQVRSGKCRSLELSLDEFNEESYLLLESSPDLIFLQIWNGEAGTAWTCFDPDCLGSNEEAPIEPSDGQSVFPMKCTMKDRELAAKCVEWYAYTLEPYPGMDWLKETW